MLILWIVLGLIIVGASVIIYNYENKFTKMQEEINANKDKIGINHGKIGTNHEKIKTNQDRLDVHYNHIEKMWISIPKDKKEE